MSLVKPAKLPPPGVKPPPASPDPNERKHMSIRVTWPGAIFTILFILQVFLILPFVLLGHWGEAWEYSTSAATVLAGWFLRGWHDDVLRKKKSTKGAT